MAERYLVVGGLGLVGRAMVDALDDAGIPAIALSRRAPDWPNSAEWHSVDLTNRAQCEALFAQRQFREVTHIVYCALQEQPDLIAGWQDAEQIQTNATMLENVLDFAAPARHLSLLQGTKAYAAHLRPMTLPGKERSARPDGANFYWNQEDLVRARSEQGGFAYTVFRPQLVCGLASGSPMNMMAAIGAYGALCAEAGEPMSFPGGGDFVTEATDARLLARCILWAGAHDVAANETYNVTNGDVIHWPSLWPELAALLNAQAGPEEARLLQREMPGREDDWRRLAEARGLTQTSLAGFVGASWQFADAVLGYGGQARSTLLSTIKLRQHGFAECIDTADMFAELFDAMRISRWLP